MIFTVDHDKYQTINYQQYISAIVIVLEKPHLLPVI